MAVDEYAPSDGGSSYDEQVRPTDQQVLQQAVQAAAASTAIATVEQLRTQP
jgi:hypothetical protein